MIVAARVKTVRVSRRRGRLVSNWEESPERMVWLVEQLPTAVHELERLWSLTLGTPFDGSRCEPFLEPGNRSGCGVTN